MIHHIVLYYTVLCYTILYYTKILKVEGTWGHAGFLASTVDPLPLNPTGAEFWGLGLWGSYQLFGFEFWGAAVRQFLRFVGVLASPVYSLAL